MNLNKLKLTKKSLLKEITDLDIYSAYIQEEISTNKMIYSPLRPEKKPSFGFFVGDEGDICFHDFVLREKGDAIRFIQLLFNINFGQALNRIASDFNLDEKFDIIRSGQSKGFTKNELDRDALISKLKEKKIVQIKSRDWKYTDLLFWTNVGVSLKTLNKYNVKPISFYFINDLVIPSEEYSYSFREFKDYEVTYKIYQPYSSKYKWFSSHSESVVQGYTQLPEKGDILIVTKSLKDVMSITENTGIPAIAFQSETIKPSKKIIDELKSRFKKIFVFYDNDYDKEVNWGLQYGSELAKYIDCDFIYIPELFKSKDFTDAVNTHGVEKAVKILIKLLNITNAK